MALIEIIRVIKNNIKKILFGIILVLIGILALVFNCGCLSMPECKGELPACCDWYRCMYLNQKNPDKSSCMSAGSECRAYRRYIFCKDEKNYPDGVNFDRCGLYLNQK